MAVSTHPRTVLRRVTTQTPRRLAALLGLLLVAAACAVTLWRITSGGATAPTSRLYISNGALLQHLVALDPATLANLPHNAGLDLDAMGPSAVSAGGSTLAVLQGNYATCDGVAGAGGVIRIRDPRSGATRSCFPAPNTTGLVGLSRDGSRLVIDGLAEMDVFDTADGSLLASVKIHETGNVLQQVIDPMARRLYRAITATGGSGAKRPEPLQITAYGLTAGAEAGSLTLPNVLAGYWQTSQEADGSPIMAQLVPAVALSSDGRTLAVVDAYANSVTLIDAEHLTVERTLTLSRTTSLLDRLLHLLLLAPGTVHAKGVDGPALQAVFAPDGRHLYVFGYKGSMDIGPSYEGLGLELIDLKRGSIVAKALDGAWVDSVQPSSDGRSVYVISRPPTPGPPYLMQRLDAASLAVKATRTLPDYRPLLLLPYGHDRPGD